MRAVLLAVLLRPAACAGWARGDFGRLAFADDLASYTWTYGAAPLALSVRVSLGAAMSWQPIASALQPALARGMSMSGAVVATASVARPSVPSTCRLR